MKIVKMKIMKVIVNKLYKENNHPLLWISYKDYGRINELVADFIIQNTNWND
jgi:hypothetical protein